MNNNKENVDENEEVYLVAIDVLAGSKRYLNNWLGRIAECTNFPYYFLPVSGGWSLPETHSDGWAFTLVPGRYVANGRLLERNDPKLPHPSYVFVAFSRAVSIGLTVREVKYLSEVIEIDNLSGLLALMWIGGVPRIERAALMADQIMVPVLLFISEEWNIKGLSLKKVNSFVVAE